MRVLWCIPRLPRPHGDDRAPHLRDGKECTIPDRTHSAAQIDRPTQTVPPAQARARALARVHTRAKVCAAPLLACAVQAGLLCGRSRARMSSSTTRTALAGARSSSTARRRSSACRWSRASRRNSASSCPETSTRKRHGGEPDWTIRFFHANKQASRHRQQDSRRDDSGRLRVVRRVVRRGCPVPCRAAHGCGGQVPERAVHQAQCELPRAQNDRAAARQACRARPPALCAHTRACGRVRTHARTHPNPHARTLTRRSAHALARARPAGTSSRTPSTRRRS